MTAEIVEEAKRVETADPAAEPYIARVRAAAARLSAVEVRPDDMRAVLLLLEQHVNVDVDVPVGSSKRAMVFVKKVVRKLTAFYLRYVGHQVTLLGQAMVRFGSAATDRVETVERRVDDERARTEAELAEIRERLARLEQRLSGAGEPGA